MGYIRIQIYLVDRDGVEIPRSEDEETAEPASSPDDDSASVSACSTTADRGASCCKSVALTVSSF